MKNEEKGVPHRGLEGIWISKEERYKNILNNIEEGYYEVDLKGNFIFFNDTACRVIGYPKEELLRMNNRQLMDSDNAQKVFEIFNYVYRTGKSIRAFEYEIQKNDGSPCNVETSISLIRDSQSNPVGFRGVVRDISERKKTEEKLELFYRFAEASGQGLLLMNTDCKIIYTNQAFCNMLGEKNSDDVLEVNIDRYYQEEDCIKLHDHIIPKVLEKGQWMGELDFMSREGKLVPTFNNLFIIRDDKEKIQYFANIITDIAEQKLGAEKLRKAMEEAYLANKAKSKFLANMSHEIRTPMNGILGFSDLLLDEELTNEQYEAVKAIKESGENLLGLINNILDLSKVESNKIVLESIPFDVEDVIFDVCDLMKSNLGEKPVEINCYVENVDSAITGDPTRLRQILINLVGNSVKFINEGDIHVRVCIEKEEENKVILRFMVKDTGPGIPEDKLEKIFESFQQVDGSTTRNFGGTGLGLSIAKKLCKIMGGDMWVESQVGIGSTFYFTSAFKKAGLPRETEKTMDLSRLSGRKILIVDDNKTARDIECELTEKGGMVPICFSGGKEALGYLKTLLENGYGNNEKNEMHEILPEVALLDLDMPEMSGHELSILIHGLTNKKISMIGISPRASLGNGRKSNEQYFSSYLSKPLREELFFSALLKTLGLGGTDRYRDANSLDGDSVEDKVKVLYVEDNLVNQKLGQKVLERLGHHVSIASDGREAVKMIKNGSYDIIFMDVHMPNMDGLEATKIIRKWENEFCKDKTDSAGKIPIVAATADAMKGDREKFIEAGMDGYVSKPFNRGDIQRAINGWVHKAGQSIKEGKDKRLLIVEDEDKVRKSIIRLLRRKMPHIKVTSASDGIDAAAKLGSFTPDLILADIMMPHMDGSEFVRYVRNNKRYKKIKVVMMTGLHKEDPRVLAVKGAGIENIVYKPWEDSELIAAIKEAILGVHNFH